MTTATKKETKQPSIIEQLAAKANGRLGNKIGVGYKDGAEGSGLRGAMFSVMDQIRESNEGVEVRAAELKDRCLVDQSVQAAFVGSTMDTPDQINKRMYNYIRQWTESRKVVKNGVGRGCTYTM